jgi:hypothetical protein
VKVLSTNLERRIRIFFASPRCSNTINSFPSAERDGTAAANWKRPRPACHGLLLSCFGFTNHCLWIAVHNERTVEALQVNALELAVELAAIDLRVSCALAPGCIDYKPELRLRECSLRADQLQSFDLEMQERA